MNLVDFSDVDVDLLQQNIDLVAHLSNANIVLFSRDEQAHLSTKITSSGGDELSVAQFEQLVKIANMATEQPSEDYFYAGKMAVIGNKKIPINCFARALSWPSGIHFATVCAFTIPPLALTQTMTRMTQLLCDQLQYKLDQQSKSMSLAQTYPEQAIADRVSGSFNEGEPMPPVLGLQVFIDSFEEHIWIKDTQGVYICCNRSVERAWGLDRGDILGKTDGELFEDDIAQRFIDGDRLAISKDGPVIVAECLDKYQQSNQIWLETFKTPAKTAQGELIGVIGVTRNIAKHKAAEVQLSIAAAVFSNTIEGVVITDRDANITEVNAAFTNITGYSFEEVKGKNPSILSSGLHDKVFYSKLWNTLLIQGRWQGEIWNRRKQGDVFPLDITINAVYDDDNTIAYFVSVFTDISDKKHTEAKIDRLVFLDPLTQLPNRTQFLSRVENAIFYAKQDNTQLAIVFIDVDFFKHINDSLGHVVGDNILVELASRFNSLLHPGAVLARLGGDEFALLLTNVNRADNLIAMLNRFNSVFEKPLLVSHGQTIRLTASMGVALYPSDGADNDSLLRHADAAMHRAKQDGRNNYAFYTESMTQESVRQLQLQSALHEALELKRFHLVYQPKVDLKTLEIMGFEALIRWEDPILGNVSPGVFIPIAEKIGLINEIGNWVLNTACRQGAAWLAQGKVFGRIAVNVASLQLQRNSFVDDVKQTLATTGLPASHLELEVTESCMLQNPNAAIVELKRLREMGISLSIDDFGTGYSSLNYLKRLPIDKLKIDRSFVQNIVQDANSAAIAKAVIALGHALNLQIIAEGVETQEQANFLKSNNCEQAQGFLYSKPKLAEDLEAFFPSHSLK